MNVTGIRELCLEAARLCADGEARQARAAAAAAVALARSAAAEGPHYATALALTTAGALAADAGDAVAARGAFAEAVRIARAVRLEDPEHAYAILAHAATHARNAGDRVEGAALDAECLAVLGEAVGTDHVRYHQLAARLGAAGPVAR